jgi:hypothetical protein
LNNAKSLIYLAGTRRPTISKTEYNNNNNNNNNNNYKAFLHTNRSAPHVCEIASQLRDLLVNVNATLHFINSQLVGRSALTNRTRNIHSSGGIQARNRASRAAFAAVTCYRGSIYLTRAHLCARPASLAPAHLKGSWRPTDSQPRH